jgi:crotonobetaine/carnitine-CoA ligase
MVVRPRHPWICSLGYYNMPQKTAEQWRNMWFHSGDALRRDEEGWYYFVDRYKDAIRRRGENISSYEVEQAVLGHPAVAECAVIAVPADEEVARFKVMKIVVGPGRLGRQRVAMVHRARARLRHPALVRFGTSCLAPRRKSARGAAGQAAATDIHDRVTRPDS